MPLSPKPPELENMAPPWMHRLWDKLTEWLINWRPMQGLGIEITDAPGGGKMITSTAAKAILEAAESRPFFVTVESIEENTYRVVPGSLNEFVPVTVDGVEDWVFEIEGSGFIYLEAELSGGGAVTGANLKSAEVMPAQPDGNPTTGSAPTSSFRPVAYVQDGAVTNFLMGSQWVATAVSSWGPTAQVVRTLWHS